MIDKWIRTIMLLEIYNDLLTSHQQEVMGFYYLQDFSLGEISEEMGISRQAVHDVIKRTTLTLNDYEDKLNILDREQKLQKQLKSILTHLRSQKAAQVEYATLMCEKLLKEI